MPLKDVEQVMNQNFFLMGRGKSEMGGPKAVAEVLNTVDGTTEKHERVAADRVVRVEQKGGLR